MIEIEIEHVDLDEALAREHDQLAGELDLLDTVADEIDHAAPASVANDIERAHDFIVRRVVPHELAECELRNCVAARDYRHVEPGYDQSEVRRLGARLGRLAKRVRSGEMGVAAEARHVLYELHALTRVHFADRLDQRAATPPSAPS